MTQKFEDSASILFYHRAEYVELISKETKYKYNTHRFKNIETRLFQTETNIGIHLTTSPFFGFNGLYSVNHNLQIDDRKFFSCLIDFMLKIYENSNIQSLSIYLPFCPSGDIDEQFIEFMEKMSQNSDFYKIERETDYIQLQTYKLPPKRRYDLKRSVSSGIYTAPFENSQLHELYEIYYSECLRRKIPVKSLQFISELLTIPNSASFQIYATTAFKEGKIVGGLITVCGPQTVSYFLPILDFRYASDQVGVKLISDHIHHWQVQKKIYFNFEASPRLNPNVRKYKQGYKTQSYKYYLVGFAKSTVKEQLNELIKTNPGFFFFPS